jgi:hypothetical protein
MKRLLHKTLLALRRSRSKTRFRLGQLVVPQATLTLLVIAVTARFAFAALGCDLNDPIRDVPRLFKESTSFKTRYLSIRNQGGEALLRRIESRLGQRYVPLYAPIDVPYTLYEIYNGSTKVGYIHGVNQKGQFGGLQVFVAQDLTGKIKTFYLQKITGPSAARFRDARFGKNIIGLSLKDFEAYDPATGKGSGRVADLSNPAPDMETDFYGILRGLKKNLVLMDELVFSGNGGNR